MIVYFINEYHNNLDREHMNRLKTVFFPKY